MTTVLVPPPTPKAAAIPLRKLRPRRVPVFLPAQASCLTCNKEIRDPLTVELLGRFCSQRCLHGHGLPMLLGLGA